MARAGSIFRSTPVFASSLRALLVAAIFAASLAIALAIGLFLADLGFLGTCQDGTCQLVAAVYVMPFGGLALYLGALTVLSLIAVRRRRS
jgi:hypothetical protein